jgi:hypothetical protein
MKILLVTLLFACSACASLGLNAPQTTDQKIAYAYSGVTAALTSIAGAVSSGQLTSAKGTTVNNMVLNVKTLLDAAHAEEAANATAASTDVALAVSALTAVQTYLTQSGVK